MATPYRVYSETQRRGRGFQTMPPSINRFRGHTARDHSRNHSRLSSCSVLRFAVRHHGRAVLEDHTNPGISTASICHPSSVAPKAPADQDKHTHPKGMTKMIRKMLRKILIENRASVKPYAY